eukprot:m.47891 g.47891  ORF g.47891 m.47891 type:complete len:230 (-) comp10540_c0_seq2:2890-3579(-)
MDDVRACLQTLEGIYFEPDQPGYTDALAQIIACSHAVAHRKPIVVAIPVSVPDVAKVLQAARRGRDVGALGTGPNETTMCICSGGHSELCSVDGALVMHMKEFKEITVDSENMLVTFGPGAKLGEILTATGKHGCAIPVGVCPTVGMGLVLGGGVGRLSRMFGLTLDNIVSLDIVLANGELQKLNKDEPSDLWWAVRGAGANFGVVTSATVKMHRAVFDLSRDPSLERL